MLLHQKGSAIQKVDFRRGGSLQLDTAPNVHRNGKQIYRIQKQSRKSGMPSINIIQRFLDWHPGPFRRGEDEGLLAIAIAIEDAGPVPLREGLLAIAIAIEDAGPAPVRKGIESAFSEKTLSFRGASRWRRTATGRP